MADHQKQELQWVHGHLQNLIDEARYCGSEEAEKLLLMFAKTTAIAIDKADANP